jgi:hypothetical protein
MFCVHSPGFFISRRGPRWKYQYGIWGDGGLLILRGPSVKSSRPSSSSFISLKLPLPRALVIHPPIEMSRFRGALPGALLATVCGVLTGTSLFITSSVQFSPCPLIRATFPRPAEYTLIALILGIATFRPALQEQADKRTFEYLHQQEKLNTELGPDMTEVKIADGLAARRREWEVRGEESASALALLEAEKNASRPPVE